jgi:hypothetical protein
VSIPSESDLDEIDRKLQLISDCVRLNSPKFVDQRFLETWINSMQAFIAKSFIGLCGQNSENVEFVLAKMEHDIENWKKLYEGIKETYGERP